MFARYAATAGLAIALALPAAQPAAAQSGNPLSSIFSCNSAGSKQEAAAAIGGVVGGLVGNRVAGSGDRTIGTVLGAALGAAAGSYIGCRMQTSDQTKAAQAARDALDRNVNGSWTNPETGASGDIRMISSQSSGEPVSLAGLRFASGVELAGGYEAQRGRYQALSTTNLRAGPSTASRVVGRLNKNDQFDSVARVRGTQWLLAGRNGVGVGYVVESQVRALQPAAPARECRTFEQTIRTSNGAPETQRYTACKNPQGEWMVQA